MLDRVIFGDNQFFGINHMSEDKAQALSERFKSLESIINVIDTAYDCGIRAFMLNTNERAGEICSYFRDNLSAYPEIRFYPSLPYAHKYATAVGEKGIFGAIKDTLISNNSTGEIFSLLTKGGLSLFERDMIKVMQLLVDIEMKIFRDLPVSVVFLQNIVTDLLLGIGAGEVFAAFADHIKTRFGAEPGFVSMNMPRLVALLEEYGVENPIVCSSINKAGYFMNPDVQAYETLLREKAFRPMAMSVLASGAVAPTEAIQYVCALPGIRSIVFGASSRRHIMETKELIDRFSKPH